MPKPKQKKIDKVLDKCFISTRIKTDKHIRNAAYRNISLVGTLDIRNIHERILKELNLKSTQESRYYEYNEFVCLLNEARVLTKPTPEDEKFDLI
jgi:actin-related protein